MTPLAIFVLFGLPLSLVALGWGAAFLHGRALDHERAAAMLTWWGGDTPGRAPSPPVALRNPSQNVPPDQANGTKKDRR